MQVERTEGKKIVLKCEHCGEGTLTTFKPVPDVIMPTLVCRDCRKDSTGEIVPVAELPS